MTDSTLKTFLDEQVEQQLIAGAVLGVVDGAGRMEVTCAGYADRAQKRPMEMDTQFWIASISKPIAATAIMCAVEDGLLDLDALVADYLPIFRQLQFIKQKTDDVEITQDCAGTMTLRQCLSHTAGFQFLSRLELEHGIDVLSLAEAVVAYAMTPLLTLPGEQYAYSNIGVNTVCRVLETQTGVDYPSYVRQRLFDPLGMSHTNVCPQREDANKIARCYQHNELGQIQAVPLPQVRPPFSDPTRTPHPAGCYFSNVMDFLRFAQLILNKGTINGQDLISAASIAEMTSSQTKLAEHAYGLCWAVDEHGFGHGGATGTHLQIMPQLNKACVYLIHHQGNAKGLSHILPWIHQHVFDQEVTKVHADGFMARD